MNSTVSDISSAVIIRDSTDNSNALPEEGATIMSHVDENDELVSDDESEVQYQMPRDPLETVRDGTNTLYVMPLIIT